MIKIEWDVMELSLKRHEVCDLLLALTAISNANKDAKKWKDLHDKIANILHTYDELKKFTNEED